MSRALAVGVLVALTMAAPVAGLEPATQQEAQWIREGAIVRHQVVALGEDLVVDGEVRDHVAVLGADATVSGSVDGDLIVLGGSAQLLRGASVTGDLYVLGGHATIDEGATVGGRSVAFPVTSSSWLVLLEGPTLGLPAMSPFVLLAKSTLVVCWGVLCLLLTGIWSRPAETTAGVLGERPLLDFWSGLVVTLAGVVLAVFLVGFAPAIVGVLMVLLVALVLLAFKLWGTVAIFIAVGVWARRRWGAGRLLPVGTTLLSALVGLLLLAPLKFIPWIGGPAWSVMTLVGMGAALRSRFGSTDPWFEEPREPA